MLYCILPSDRSFCYTNKMAIVERSHGFLPRNLWYQDPVYKSYSRLVISDIIAMLPYGRSSNEESDAFAYKNHPIYRVDILGLIVSVAERDKFFSYAVDDGTGVIQCCCWKPKPRVESGHGTHPSGDAEGELAASLQQRMEESDDALLTPCELGDLIHVRGRIKKFRGNTEVSASYFRKIQDSTFQTEMQRMEETPILYQSVYDQPFRLPSNMRQTLTREEEEKEGLRREADLISDVQTRLVGLLEDGTIQNFYLHELETLKELLDVASAPCVEYQQGEGSRSHGSAKQIKSIFKTVAERLEGAGNIFKSSVELGLYQAVHRNHRLNETILAILRSDCQQPKYEGGCHYLHVVDRLHNMSGYEHISPDAVKTALSCLESESHVISTTQKHYMAIT